METDLSACGKSSGQSYHVLPDASHDVWCSDEKSLRMGTAVRGEGGGVDRGGSRGSEANESKRDARGSRSEEEQAGQTAVPADALPASYATSEAYLDVAGKHFVDLSHAVRIAVAAERGATKLSVHAWTDGCQYSIVHNASDMCGLQFMGPDVDAPSFGGHHQRIFAAQMTVRHGRGFIKSVLYR
eukprot:1678935-Rhodomonas_salina.2